MRTLFLLLFSIGITLASSAVLFAKGETTKITIVGTALPHPIEITDTNIVQGFQVWSGPGTTVCNGGRANCVEGTEGFIVDWSNGALATRPSDLQRYEVSFYVVDARQPGQPSAERLAYVVSYEYDSSTSQGYVYLPGKGDQWYALNSGSIFRGREGNWFLASPAWQAVVRPLIEPH